MQEGVARNRVARNRVARNRVARNRVARSILAPDDRAQTPPITATHSQVLQRRVPSRVSAVATEQILQDVRKVGLREERVVGISVSIVA